MFGDPWRGECSPGFRLPTPFCQTQAVRAVGVDVDGVGDLVGGEYLGQPVGVFRRDVRVLGGVPDEEGGRRRGHHGVKRRGSPEFGAGVLSQEDQACCCLLYTSDAADE